MRLIRYAIHAYQVVCQNIDAVIPVLETNVQDLTRTRTLILDLVHQFIEEEDDGIYVEAIKCIQHFLMFAPHSARTSTSARQLTTAVCRSFLRSQNIKD